MYKALAFTLSVISHCFIPWSFSFKQPERVAKPPGPHSGLCLSTAGSVPRGCQAHVGHQLFSQISFQMQALHLQPSNPVGLTRTPEKTKQQVLLSSCSRSLWHMLKRIFPKEKPDLVPPLLLLHLLS